MMRLNAYTLEQWKNQKTAQKLIIKSTLLATLSVAIPPLLLAISVAPRILLGMM